MKEETRPTIYRVMKYWGKKPHNIWNAYIKKYSNKNCIVLDPFVGSGMTYFESIKAGRIPFTIDLNPLSDLCIKCLTLRNINYRAVSKQASDIILQIKESACYKKEYVTRCTSCGAPVDIYNYKINGKYTVSYKCSNCKKTITDIIDKTNSHYKIDKWVPSKKLSDLESVQQGFIKKIGNDNISAIWSNRNLKLLSELYDQILSISDQEIKMVLVFAFIQCLHLTSKMCIPRNEKSNRPLSTSWGRPAYMVSDKIFEQNPLLAFEKAVNNSTGVLKGIKSSEKYLGSTINKSAKHILGDSYSVLKRLDNDSIDMIITDPPYGSIIQYGDLSEVWVSWLEHYKSDYYIEHKKEVIVNKSKNQKKYESDLYKIFGELNRVIKNDGYMVLTFNSNSNEDWISLLNALKKSNFLIDKVILQKNKRSSEANVAAKEGIAISDYYLICKKGKWSNSNITKFLKERGIDF